MVRLKGPMGSAEASGGLGPSTVFSSWKGRAYARTKTIPTNPKTPAQIATRAGMKYLTPLWPTLLYTFRDSWLELAAQTQIPAYNAYLSTNLTRIATLKGPSNYYPILENLNNGNIDTITTTGHPAHVTIVAKYYTRNQTSGMLIFRSQTPGFTPAPDNLIGLAQIKLLEAQIYDDTDLEPGTYYYRFKHFTLTGLTGDVFHETSAIAT